MPSESERTKDDIYQRDWQSPKRTVQKYFNDKLHDTRAIAEKMSKFCGDEQEFYVYKVDGFPVGMLLTPDVTIKGYLYIDFLVTHPDAEGCGGALIEYAVNRSVALGAKGKIALEPLLDAMPAYFKMGFIGDRDEMTLDPAKSDIWDKNEQGEWKLKHLMGKRYMVTAFN